MLRLPRLANRITRSLDLLYNSYIRTFRKKIVAIQGPVISVYKALHQGIGNDRVHIEGYGRSQPQDSSSGTIPDYLTVQS